MAKQPKGLYKRPANSRMRTISLDQLSDSMLSQMASPGGVSNFLRSLICREYGRREALKEADERHAAKA